MKKQHQTPTYWHLIHRVLTDIFSKFDTSPQKIAWYWFESIYIVQNSCSNQFKFVRNSLNFWKIVSWNCLKTEWCIKGFVWFAILIFFIYLSIQGRVKDKKYKERFCGQILQGNLSFLLSIIAILFYSNPPDILPSHFPNTVWKVPERTWQFYQAFHVLL